MLIEIDKSRLRGEMTVRDRPRYRYKTKLVRYKRMYKRPYYRRYMKRRPRLGRSFMMAGGVKLPLPFDVTPDTRRGRYTYLSFYKGFGSKEYPIY